MEIGRIEVSVKFNGESLATTSFDGKKPENVEDIWNTFSELVDFLKSPVVSDPELF